MALRFTAKAPSLTESLRTEFIKARMATLKGVTRAGSNLKDDLRSQVEAAGFGDRLAKTWQGRVYENGGTNPAAFVFSKAPKIIDAFSRGATIVATGGRRLLALPTDGTPRQRSGGKSQQARAKTPKEVEAQFGRKLRFVPAASSKGFRARSRGANASAVGYLIMDGLVFGDRTGRLRNASARQRLLSGTGKAKPVTGVVMFTLVPRVKMPKIFDLQATADRFGATVPQLIAEEWG